MPNSKRFWKLHSELSRLRKHFLPRHWDPTGTYSERKLDHARAYRILAHAEIESFVESILGDVVDRYFQQWQKSQQSSRVIVCLMTTTEVVKKENESIERAIERAVEHYRYKVGNNNGIRERNLTRLLVPVGIALSDLDQTWLNDMDSFGRQRGFVAHTSRLGVSTPPDPKTEKDTVDGLLTGLKVLDKLIREL